MGHFDWVEIMINIMDKHTGASVYENLSDIRKYLSIVNYPATKEDIFKKAQSQGANINVMTLFQTIPPNKTYHTPKDVLIGMGLTF